MNAPIVLPEDMREDDWLSFVVDYAMHQGWRVQHIRPTRTGKGFRTPVQGHSGAPDLLLARSGEVVLVELKRNSTYPRADQREWLNHLGTHGCVWRPRDVDKVMARLSRSGVWTA